MRHMQPDLLTIAQVAKALGVTRSTVARWAREETLPSVRVGGVVRFRPEAITEVLDRGLSKEATA